MTHHPISTGGDKIHMYGPVLPLLATEAQSGGIAWDVALGVGSLVMLVGGVTALVKRSIRPSQALGVLAVALAVATIAALASQFPGSFYPALITLTSTTAGAAMAVAVVIQPVRRIR
jgi:hypothetical protein